LRILLCEDDENLGMLLREYLQAKGYSAELYPDGEAGFKAFLKNKYDLCVFDVMMPKKDGFTLAQEVRSSSNVPIIMITAKGDDGDRIMGLDIGADDYIVKPFSPGEVMARIRAVLRRLDISEEQRKDIVRHPGLEINISDYEVTTNGQPLSLTKKEIEIFWLLASYPGRVFSRDNLLSSVWGDEYFGDARTVDTHIQRLRSKLAMTERSNWDIKTIWGVGYKFEVKHV